MAGKQEGGFTLVELAVVLVIIGLIMGMAFKGKDLIDGAKIKNMQAQYLKVQAGINAYYNKYGAYPGDGCPVAAPAAVSACSGVKNGQLDQTEAQAALAILQTTQILSAADVQSVFGQPWAISPATATASGNFEANTSYLTLPVSAVSTAPGAQADARMVCALDRAMDDGLPASGAVRSDGSYAASDDCWALSGLLAVGMRLLP
ncbi:type II secretion system protein [Chitinilyticum litopenaei]|uniref:type II secretion system protein n=1 Tax=Chitinilyticum litopenaei TaxID=1121276 RepID=UPI0004083293|nr:prepilin-type N-terminal cleavage/methylation domain-containing protein [Chitinilyticum litopenaei]